MQAIERPQLRKTPFGDTPAPSEFRISGELFSRSPDGDHASAGPAYEIFSLKPALDGLAGGSAGATC